ncbi:hypothetical protein XELAEV_18028389mg [Xenopus laevis]|nr:hypothetical protein XELAEV_18028389mg [Xenopus laevis]
MELSVTVTLFSQLALGVAVNGFIVGTYLLEWRKNRSLHISDTVLMSLALNRFLWQLFHTLASLFSFVQVTLTATYKFLYCFCAFLNWSSLWFAAILSVIHCVKISNYNNSLFIWLKLRLCRLVKWLIVANLLTSLAFTIAPLWFVFPHNQSTSIDVPQNNATLNPLQNIPSPLFVLCLGSLLPFLIFCVAVSLLINSLRMHVRQMRSRATGFQVSHVEAHLRVIKGMVFFLVLFLLYFSVIILGADKKTDSNWIYFYLGLAFYPSLHSAVLIYSTRQLRTACLAIYHGAKTCICVPHGNICD